MNFCTHHTNQKRANHKNIEYASHDAKSHAAKWLLESVGKLLAATEGVGYIPGVGIQRATTQLHPRVSNHHFHESNNSSIIGRKIFITLIDCSFAYANVFNCILTVYIENEEL